MNEKRVRVVITGYVQGVGFRAACRAQALRRGVAGWVRNRWDGSVEALFEGPSDAVDALIEWCREGPAGAEVSDVQVEPAPPGPSSSTFSIRLF